MNTCTANPLPIPLPSAVPPMRAVAVVALSTDDIEAWLWDEESRIRSLAGRALCHAAELSELHDARAHLDRALAALDHLALDHLALDHLAIATEPEGADAEAIGWLHTRSSALVEAIAVALDRVDLDRVA